MSLSSAFSPAFRSLSCCCHSPWHLQNIRSWSRSTTMFPTTLLIRDVILKIGSRVKLTKPEYPSRPLHRFEDLLSTGTNYFLLFPRRCLIGPGTFFTSYPFSAYRPPSVSRKSFKQIRGILKADFYPELNRTAGRRVAHHERPAHDFSCHSDVQSDGKINCCSRKCSIPELSIS